MSVSDCLKELADQARIAGRRAASPEDRLAWAKAEVELSRLADKLASEEPDGDQRKTA